MDIVIDKKEKHDNIKMSIPTDAHYSTIRIDHNININNIDLFDLENGLITSALVPYESYIDVAKDLVNDALIDFSNLISTNVNNLDIRVTGYLDVLQSNVIHLSGDMVILDSAFIELEDNVDDLQFKLDAFKANVNDLHTSIRGNVHTLEARLSTVNTNVQRLFTNLETSIHSAQYNIHTLRQRIDLLEGLNVFEPVFTMVSTDEATIVFRNLQRGTSVRVTIMQLHQETTILETNIYLDTLVITGLSSGTTYSANIGSPDYFTVTEFTTPTSSDFSLTFTSGNVSMQGPLSIESTTSMSIRTYLKDITANNTVYSSEIAGGYSGALVTFDVSGNISIGNTYVFEVKDIVIDVVLANIEF